MGFNRKQVTTVDAVKREIEDDGIEKFVRSILKCDAIVGPPETVDFIEKIVNDFQKKNDQCITSQK